MFCIINSLYESLMEIKYIKSSRCVQNCVFRVSWREQTQHECENREVSFTVSDVCLTSHEDTPVIILPGQM